MPFLIFNAAIHMLERRAHGNSLASGEDAAHTNTSGWSLWGGTGSVLYHVELLSDLAIHILTLAHYLHVWYLHGLSFHVSMLREALRALRGGGGSSGASALAASSVLHTAHSVLGQAVHMVKEAVSSAGAFKRCDHSDTSRGHSCVHAARELDNVQGRRAERVGCSLGS